MKAIAKAVALLEKELDALVAEDVDLVSSRAANRKARQKIGTAIGRLKRGM